MNNFFSSIFFLCLFVSCSLIDSTNIENQEFTIKAFAKNNCEKKDFKIVADNDENHDLLFRYKENLARSLVRLAILEMRLRPDQVHPMSRSQVLLYLNSKWTYLDFGPQAKYPLIDSLRYIWNQLGEKSSFDLFFNSALIEMSNKKLSLNAQFSSFLDNHKDKVIPPREETTNDETKIIYDPIYEFYLKNTDVLKEKESLPEMKFHSKFKASSNVLASSPTLFQFQNGSCNFDLTKYERRQNELKDIVDSESHFFGLTTANQAVFIISSYSIDLPLASDEKSTFFKGKTPHHSIPMCLIDTSYGKLAIVANGKSDAAQHIFHLISYDISQAASARELEVYMKFPRHLNLRNPDRILFETYRGRKKQLDQFLKLNLPIYHVQNLGSLSMLFEKNQAIYPILDPRFNNQVYCP